MVVACLCALGWFSAHPGSPYSALPEVVFARKLTLLLFWRLVDGVYNPVHIGCVAVANAVLQVLSYLLPVVETLPEAVLLAVTELGGLVLDLALVAAAAGRALLLKALYCCVYVLDALLAGGAALLQDTDGFLKGLLEWLLRRDPLGLLLSLLLARPFTQPAHLLLAASKAVIQWTMAAVELACALLYAAPAGLGVVLLPALYVAHAVWRRARRTLVSEPPLSFTVAELEAKVALLQPLRVPPLPIQEKRVESEIMGFVNAVATLQPLSVPPLDTASLAQANAAEGLQERSRAQQVDAVVARSRGQTAYSVTSSTQVTMNSLTDSYAGLAAVRAKMDSFEQSVAQLPPLADASRAQAARGEAQAAQLALAAAEAALAEAEAAFYAIDGSISATTTTTTTLSVDSGAAGEGMAPERGMLEAQAMSVEAEKPAVAAPPAGTQQLRREAGNGPQRSSALKEVLIRGLAAGLGAAAAAESNTQSRKAKEDKQ